MNFSAPKCFGKLLLLKDFLSDNSLVKFKFKKVFNKNTYVLLAK